MNQEESLNNISDFLSNQLESVLSGNSNEIKSLLYDIKQNLSSKKENNSNIAVNPSLVLNVSSAADMKEMSGHLSEVVAAMSPISEVDVTQFANKVKGIYKAFSGLSDIDVSNISKINEAFNSINGMANLDSETFHTLDDLKEKDVKNFFNSLSLITNGINEIKNINNISDSMKSLNASISSITEISKEDIKSLNESVKAMSSLDISDSISGAKDNMAKVFDIFSDIKTENVKTFNDVLLGVDYTRLQNISDILPNSIVSLGSMDSTIVENFRTNLRNIRFSLKPIAEMTNIDTFSNNLIQLSVALSNIDPSNIDTISGNLNSLFKNIDKIKLKTDKASDYQKTIEAMKDVLSPIASISEDEIKNLSNSLSTLPDIISEVKTGKVNNSFSKMSELFDIFDTNLGNLNTKIGSLKTPFAESVNNIKEQLKPFSEDLKIAELNNNLKIMDFVFSNIKEKDVKNISKGISNVFDAFDKVSISDSFKGKMDNIISSLNVIPSESETKQLQSNIDGIIDTFSNIEKGEIKDTVKSVKNIMESVDKLNDETITSFSSKMNAITDSFSAITNAKNVGAFADNFNTITSTFSNIDKKQIKAMSNNISDIVKNINTEELKAFKNAVGAMSDSLTSIGNIGEGHDNFVNLISTYTSVDKKDIKNAIDNMSELGNVTAARKLSSNNSGSNDMSDLSNKIDSLTDAINASQSQMKQMMQTLIDNSSKPDVAPKVTEEVTETNTETSNNNEQAIGQVASAAISGNASVAALLMQINQTLNAIQGNIMAGQSFVQYKNS